MRRRQYLTTIAGVSLAVGVSGCSTLGEDDEPSSDLRGELAVTLRNGLDSQTEARFLLVSPDGVPVIDARPELPPDESWQARASGLVPGRYSYTVGGPRFSGTDFWVLDQDCPRFVVDAVIADQETVNVSEQCESLETESE